MDKRRLKIRHINNILKLELVNILSKLQIKDLLRRKLEGNTAVFKESLEIDSNCKSILVLPNIPWSYRWQRPQQIFTRMARKGFNIFYISPITSDREYITEISKKIYEVHIKTRKEGNVLRDFHLDGENTKDFVNSFNTVLNKYIKNDSLLFVLHPVWKDISLEVKNVKRIYDLMDLYSGFPDAREELIEAEEVLIKKSDIVLTTADNLYDYAKKLNNNVHMIRNGSDYEKFADLKENGKINLKDKPIVGYYGAISQWLDVDLLEYAIKNNKDKYFVFIGSLGTTNIRKLYKYSNVYFLGEVSHDELPGYLAYFDVCTIPFILNDLIKSTNPVKFYEYIASGKPVVSVDLPELKQYENICYLSKNKEEFSKNIFKALHDEAKEIIEKRKIVAEENSWDNRVEELIKIIK
jgi:hypothetical protein